MWDWLKKRGQMEGCTAVHVVSSFSYEMLSLPCSHSLSRQATWGGDCVMRQNGWEGDYEMLSFNPYKKPLSQMVRSVKINEL